MSTSSGLFNRILVATDESAAGATATAVGRRIAAREGGTLLLLRVESDSADLPKVFSDTALLKQQSSEISESGIHSYYRVEYGNPAENIAVVAAEEAASLILLAHRHRGLLDGMLHPSVSARLLPRAPVPLLIWPDESPAESFDDFLTLPNSVVLVPLDGSIEAERALPLAAEIAKRSGCVLLLTRVLEPLPLGMAGGPYYTQPVPTEEENQDARAYLGATRKRLAVETGLIVQSLLLEGNATSEIGKALLGHEGSLAVMTTHGRTGFGKLVLGSVAASLIDRARVPLLVVPPLVVQRATAAVTTEQRETNEAPVATPALVPGAALT